MKKVLFSAAALLLSSSLFAQQGNHGVYMGVGLGLEAMPKHVDNGLGLAVKGGIHLDEVLPHLGAEMELTTSLVAPEYKGGVDINVFTLGFYATYTIALPNTPIAIRPKFGFILPNLSDEINSRDFALSTGIAGVYTINRVFDAYVEYVNTSEAMNNYMVGFNINF